MSSYRGVSELSEALRGGDDIVPRVGRGEREFSDGRRSALAARGRGRSSSRGRAPSGTRTRHGRRGLRYRGTGGRRRSHHGGSAPEARSLRRWRGQQKSRGKHCARTRSERHPDSPFEGRAFRVPRSGHLMPSCGRCQMPPTVEYQNRPRARQDAHRVQRLAEPVVRRVDRRRRGQRVKCTYRVGERPEKMSNAVGVVAHERSALRQHEIARARA